MSKKVAGIIVTYNPDIILLRESLEATSEQLECIYLIDNNSKNSSEISNLSKLFRNTHFKSFAENVGLAKAQNLGIELARENSEVDYIILFDQDSVIENNFIDTLLSDYLNKKQNGCKIGAIGPSFYDPITGFKYPATVYVGPFIKRIVAEKEPIKATYLIASGCFISKDVLNEVGLMRSELFIDYIDVEWSLRAKSLGYDLFISPNANMAHTIGDARRSIFGRTISIHSPFRRYFLVRNSFYMLRLNYVPLGYKLRELFFNFARIIISAIFSDNRLKTLKSAFFGIIDGISGKFGPLKRDI